MNMMLTKEHIYAIHSEAINEFGGDNGNYDYTDSKIESILSQQYGYFGHDKYDTVFKKAVMLSYFFTKGHCFVDGNKRVGLYVLQIFLDLNGYELTLNNIKAEELVLEMSKTEFRGQDIDNYIYELSVIIQRNSENND